VRRERRRALVREIRDCFQTELSPERWHAASSQAWPPNWTAILSVFIASKIISRWSPNAIERRK
jgi:hypothetical protein